MRYVVFSIFFCFIFSSCTYSVVVSGNAGPGVDSVEETDTVDPVISPTISATKGVL